MSCDTFRAAMKRLLLILAMLVIPAQAALAALCAYCPHSAGTVAEHAVAHGQAFEHADSDDAADRVDGGCPACHLGSASMPPPSCAAAAHDAPIVRPPHRAVLYDPSHLDPIERIPLACAVSS